MHSSHSVVLPRRAQATKLGLKNTDPTGRRMKQAEVKARAFAMPLTGPADLTLGLGRVAYDYLHPFAGQARTGARPRHRRSCVTCV